MKKILFIFIVLFVHRDVFADTAVEAINYNRSNLASWANCIATIMNDESELDTNNPKSMLSRMVGSESKVVSDKDTTNEEKARLHKIFIEKMAEKCDGQFADIAQEAEGNTKQNTNQGVKYAKDIPLKVGFKIEYGTAIGGKSGSKTDGFSLEIIPAKDFELYYPKYIGFLVTSQKVKEKPRGSIIKASDIKSDIVENLQQAINACEKDLSSVAEKYFHGFLSSYIMSYSVDFSSQTFPGLLNANNSYMYEDYGRTSTSKRITNSNPVVAYKANKESLNNILDKFKNFCKDDTLIKKCPGLNIYPVYISGQTPKTDFYTKSTTTSIRGGMNAYVSTATSYSKAGSGIATALEQPIVVVNKEIFPNRGDYNNCSTNPR